MSSGPWGGMSSWGGMGHGVVCHMGHGVVCHLGHGVVYVTWVGHGVV